MRYEIVKAANCILAISDDNIEAGDVYIDDTGLIRRSVTNNKDYWNKRPNYKKVIAYLPDEIVKKYISNAERLNRLPLLPDIDEENYNIPKYFITETEINEVVEFIEELRNNIGITPKITKIKKTNKTITNQQGNTILVGRYEY